MKQRIALLLLLLSITLVFSACGKTETPSEGDTAPSGTESSAPAPTADELYQTALNYLQEGKLLDSYKLLIQLENHSEAEELLSHFVWKASKKVQTRQTSEYITELTYNLSGHKTLVNNTWDESEAGHQEYSYEYNSNGFLTKAISSKESYTYTYHANGKISKIEIMRLSQGMPPSLSGTYTYEYDAKGNEISIAYEGVDGYSHTTTIEYNASGESTKRIYSVSDGYVETVIWSYNTDGTTKSQQITNSDGYESTAVYEYDSAKKITKETVTTEGSSTSVKTYTYNDQGLLIKEETITSYGMVFRNTYEYRGTTLSKMTVEETDRATIVNEYDEYGNLIKVTDQNSVTEYSEYQLYYDVNASLYDQFIHTFYK